MICHGEPNGHSAMARTVGLPVAIATKMMLDGESKSCLPPWKIFLSFFLFIYLFIYRGYYTVARRYEFYFRVAKQYFTNERSEWIKYCFCHEKIKFISSSRLVMFFLLYRQKDIDKIKDFYSPKSNCDGSYLQHSNKRHWLQQPWEITLSWIGLYNDKI